MTAEIELLIHELAQLPPSSKAFLAPEIEAAWNETADRRWADIVAGKVHTIPANEAFASTRSALKY